MHPPILISTVLRRAIDVNLPSGNDDRHDHGYSCTAMWNALSAIIDEGFRDENNIWHPYPVGYYCKMSHRLEGGLEAMGADCGSVRQFTEFKLGKKRQTARALWLEWAHMMAVEQGV